jgi:hypothetical protein
LNGEDRLDEHQREVVVVLTSYREFSRETAKVLAHLFEVQACILGRMQASNFLFLLVELFNCDSANGLDYVHPNDSKRFRFAVGTQEFS